MRNSSCSVVAPPLMHCKVYCSHEDVQRGQTLYCCSLSQAALLASKLWATQCSAASHTPLRSKAMNVGEVR